MKNYLLTTVLRALVYALCTAVFIWPLASLTTALAGGLGAGIGVLLGVFTNRLARAVDRARGLESKLAAADPGDALARCHPFCR